MLDGELPVNQQNERHLLDSVIVDLCNQLIEKDASFDSDLQHINSLPDLEAIKHEIERRLDILEKRKEAIVNFIRQKIAGPTNDKDFSWRMAQIVFIESKLNLEMISLGMRIGEVKSGKSTAEMIGPEVLDKITKVGLKMANVLGDWDEDEERIEEELPLIQLKQITGGVKWDHRWDRDPTHGLLGDDVIYV